jgi:hypothetical protein
MEFPNPKKFITEDEIRQEIKNLESYNYTIIEEPYIISNMLPDYSVTIKSRSDTSSTQTSANQKKGNDRFPKKYVTPNAQGKRIVLEPYTKLDIISSVYTGDAKSKCRRSDEEYTPLEYWNMHWEELVNDVGEDPEKLDNLLWSEVTGCGNFRPKLMAGAIEYFGAQSVLDFSSGWGDRLIGAISKGIRYVGVDPNPALHKSYEEIINKFAKNKKLYTMIESPFQTAILPEGETFDLVFTSPPYFDLELYATPLESNNLEVWKLLFLYPSLEKAWSRINPGGHMCIIINDYKETKYVNDMVRYVSTFAGAEYLGTHHNDKYTPYLAYAAEKKPDVIVSAQPMWTWKKTGALLVPNPFNPDIVITEHKVNYGSVNVIRDDMLEGSTKQRALYEWIKSYKDTKEFVYAGPDNGHGQLSISIICNALSKKTTLFLQSSTGKNSDLVDRSIKHGAKVYLYTDRLRNVVNEARKYVARTPGSLFIPLGVDTTEYQRLMVKSIKSSFPDDIVVKRMWVTVGSANLLKSLSVVFPDTEFIIVRVGKKVYLDEYPDLESRIVATYDATTKYKFSHNVKESDAPPYPSSKTYDAKMWAYILNDAKDGDFVWNAASY